MSTPSLSVSRSRPSVSRSRPSVSRSRPSVSRSRPRIPAIAWLAFLALTLGCQTAWSAPSDGHSEGATCRHHGSRAKNRSSFQVEAVREVANDWAKARLSVQAEGKQAAAVAGEVNAAMKNALKRAERAAGIEVRSGGYSTHPVYDDGRVVRWRATQALLLESGDTDALSALIGVLQSESVLLVAIEFGVRRESRQAVEDELISEALTRFRGRAELVATGMGAKSWALDDVNVGTQSSSRPPIYRERADAYLSSAKAPAPAFSAGTSEIRVTASGTVVLE